jgi:hypothetical protein
MFTSHKGDAQPRPRQSSMESSAPRHPSFAAPSEPWASECIDDHSYAYNAMQSSPEERYRSYSGKRSSVFNLRSRSNTGASTTSTILSSSLSGMSENDTSRPGTSLTVHQHDQSGHSERSGSRKSLFRGRKGKRLSETVPSNIVVTEAQEQDGGERRMSLLRKNKKRNNQTEQTCKHLLTVSRSIVLTNWLVQSLKNRISSPFGFQHLTHTDRQHVTTHQQTTGGTEDITNGLHFSNFSSDNLVAQESRSPSALSFGSPPQSPRKYSDLKQSSTAQQQPYMRPGLRLTRSVESFSQPGVNIRNHRYSQSVLAPARLASLTPLAAISDTPEDSPPQIGRSALATRSRRESGMWDTFSLATTPEETYRPVSGEDPSYFGHAFTTPDDMALPAMASSFSPSLDDVAEEPERFVKPRQAPQPPTVKGFTTASAPHFDTSIFNDQYSPEVRQRNRGDSHASPRSFNRGISTSRPLSQGSDTLGSSDLVRRGSTRKPYTKRHESNKWRASEESWEDSIDYIYDHALEADCDFEWECAPDDITELEQRSGNDYRTSVQRTHQPLLTLQPAYEPTSQYQTREFRVSLLVPNVPDLVPTSAASVSTMGTGLTTPCTSFHGPSPGNIGGFMISPSLLIPPEYKEDPEDTYEDLLNAYEDSERHFPMLDPRYSGTSSARSRRSSYDSSLMSSAMSFAMLSSPVRRSASSAGSVPDLVPSRRTRRDLGFSLMIDQLADSVTSLSHLDEEQEEEETTPPGQALVNRTFFPTEDEPEEVINHTNDIEEELKSSLELARRGSQRSAHPSRHHKQARSDGAAKLLSAAPIVPEDQPTKKRSRAATLTHAAKSPMLSLFPTPPRHSPRM